MTAWRKRIVLDDNDQMNDTDESPQDVSPLQVAPVSLDLKRRMRELLSIPDSQRSDEQWDELIEIEIQLAPGNRLGSAPPRQSESRGQGHRGGGGGGVSVGGNASASGPGGGNWKRNSSGRKHKPGGGGPKKPPQPAPGT